MLCVFARLSLLCAMCGIYEQLGCLGALCILRSCNVLKLQLPHRLRTDFEMASALQTQHLFAGDVRTDGKIGSTSAEGENLWAILCFLSAFWGMRGFLGFRATRDAMAKVSLQILLFDPCTVVCAAVFCASCAGQVCLF